MTAIKFANLPLSVRIMTCASIFMAWVMVAEFVIDRYRFDEFIPYYRVGDVCPYDLLVAGLVFVFWVLAHRRTFTET